MKLRNAFLAAFVIAAGACSDATPTGARPGTPRRSIIVPPDSTATMNADGDTLPPPPGDFECNGGGILGSGGRTCP